MLILASKSKARRKLLEGLGIKFKVVVPRVREVSKIGLSAKACAQENALRKACAVADRLKRGIVIGCDTLIEQDGKVFGKPKTLKEAYAMLRRFSCRPHRIFTGIAVVDAATRKRAVSSEETKIWMRPLSDGEIRQYFKKVSPLDKAGSFDIQGLGGLFIRRIKGCYFNVVGLPLARLCDLLKKIGVSLLFFLCVLTVAGCTTEFNLATKQQDLIFYSTDKEVRIGDSLSKQVEKNYTVIHDPELNERLERVGRKVVEVSDRQELIYRFRIIEDEKDKDLVNAVSLPGGYIYVFKKLMEEADTDDELAAVLSHEVAHVVARHGIKRLQAIWGYSLLSVLTVVGTDPEFAQGAQLAYLQLLMGYSRQDELTADRLGARYAQRAGYKPEAMLDFLEKLRQIRKKEKPRALSYFRTHPYIGERIRATKEEIGKDVSFEDYINTL